MTIHIKDILLTIRLSINDEYDGFTAAFSQSTNKSEFINMTLMVLHSIGDFWDAILSVRLERQVKADEALYFFNDKVKDFFHDPLNTKFHSKISISNEDRPLISLFTRLALLKALYECLLKNPEYLTDNVYTAIGFASRMLNRQFNQLPSATKQNITVNGEVVTSVNQLEDINRRHSPLVIRNFAGLVAISFTFMGFLQIYKRYEDELSDSTKMLIEGAAFLIALFALYKLGKQFHGFHQLHFLNATRDQLNNNSIATITTNNTINKFFIVSDEDLATLKDHAIKSRHQKKL